jgi:hypothetical protein
LKSQNEATSVMILNVAITIDLSTAPPD